MASTQQFQNFTQERVTTSFENFSKEALTSPVLQKLFNVGDTSNYDEGFTSLEGGTWVGFLNESENLNEVRQNQGYETTLSANEFGGEVRVTLKERNRYKDPTTIYNKVVDSKVTNVQIDMLNFVNIESYKLYNDGFTTALAPGGVTIFGTHTYASTDATFTNRVTTAAGEQALSELEQYGGNFKDAFGKPKPMMFKTIIVKLGGSAETAFRNVFDKNISPDSIGNVNIYNYGQYKLVASPYITSDTAWYAMAMDQGLDNPLKVDFVDRPHIENTYMDKNLDYVTQMAGSFKTGCVNLPLNLYGSTGA